MATNRKSLQTVARIAQACSWASPEIEVVIRDNSGDAQKRALIAQFARENCKVVSVDPCDGPENFTAALKLTNAIAAGDAPRAETELKTFDDATTRAHHRTDGPLWWAGSRVPILGRNIDAVSTIAAQSDAIADDAMPGIVAVADRVQADTFRPRNGRVDLEAVAPADEEELLALLREHAERTGSAVAERLLADWDVRRFTKVMPHDLKAVLDLPLSAGGIGFVTRESEEAVA